MKDKNIEEKKIELINEIKMIDYNLNEEGNKLNADIYYSNNDFELSVNNIKNKMQYFNDIGLGKKPEVKQTENELYKNYFFDHKIEDINFLNNGFFDNNMLEQINLKN